ncbi:hypothetical protein ASPZODRAFT_157567 [Penicilliopsis zonata CBS 506.65]|uniref:Uracil-DNA glycosylase-like domain-containing protein n=1 Tax=Penicilliopsis zonata CBS 506.65 TaxID=1073090 RepID=A0A1L9SPV8_9EURO|nr:hypothetical protein ASPZODRAFT_157567 [Penicilliopsis zonata CBS 506.65]OJJ49104.1 hypothetical protein ASPZODRAFT_157567 [Penicilliopsis zonata CBS 506.65]
MGRLIKNHWARLIILTAAAWQVGGSIEGFIWPKVFWDFISKNLNGAVTPVPILQILNLLLGLFTIAWEWPLKPLAGTFPHRSIAVRLALYPLCALIAAMMYQTGDVAIYYLIGISVYFWAYSEGETSNYFAENDVPVNKQLSFDGKLHQFYHTAKCSQVSAETKPAAKSQPSRYLFRQRLDSRDPTPSGDDKSSRSVSFPRKKKRSRPPSSSTPPPASLLRDTIPPNLILLLVGVNPGILTGATGHAYAHPSNLFWKLLHSSGITTARHQPSDTYRLPKLYSVGNTNIVERPTRDASMLTRSEMDAGVPVLEAKVAAQRPEAVALVGKGIWEALWRVRHGRPIRKDEFRYGWQHPRENMGRTGAWDGAPVFVATTTSGLAAGMSLAEKQAVWLELGKWVAQKREERSLSETLHD